MTRKKVREHLFKMLFLLDFYSREELDSQASRYLEEEVCHNGAAEGETEESLEKVCGAVELMLEGDVDAAMNQYNKKAD